MGTVVPFPDAWRIPTKKVLSGDTATIMILPVVRVAKPDDNPDEVHRRKRGSRRGKRNPER